MRLTQASDFALRLMILLAKRDAPQSIGSLSAQIRVPQSHLMKIVARLAAAGFVATQRGPGGGVQLSGDAGAVRIGSVVRAVEGTPAVVACLGEGPCDCVFLPRCSLKAAMAAATEAFFDRLDAFTLAEIAAGTQMPRLR
jgi:Rrf2 family nitric oxide-sensitive transcriptional repressor